MSAPTTREGLSAVGHSLRELTRVRWIRIVLVFLAVLFSLRLGLGLLFGHVLNTLAEPRGLECRWESLELSLFGGSGEVRFLELKPSTDPSGVDAPGITPLVEIEYAVFDLELLPLLAGQLRIRRAEVDGLDTRLERAPDGRWNIEEHIQVAELLALLEGSDEPAEAESDDSELDLTVPIAIEALRLQHARLHVLDRAVEPELDLVLEANARLSTLNTRDRPARFSLIFTGGELLDGASVHGEASWTESALRVRMDAQAGALRPAVLTPYLEALDVRPACETLAAKCALSIDARVLGEARDTLQATLSISGCELRVDGERALGLEALTARLDSLSPTSAQLSAIEVSGVRASAQLPSDDVVRIAGFELLGSSGAGAREGAGEAPAAWAQALAGLVDLWAPESWPPYAALLVRDDPQAYPWSLDSLTVRDAAFEFEDHTLAEPVAVEIVVDEFGLSDIVHDPRVEARAIPLVARLRTPATVESIRVDGHILPFAPTRSLQLTGQLDGLGLTSVRPYLDRAGIESTIEEGGARFHLEGGATTDADGRTEGWIELRDTALIGGEELFNVESVAVRDLVIDPAQRLIRVGDVAVEGPQLSFGRDPSSRFLAFGVRSVGRAAALAPAKSVDEAAPPNADTAPGPPSEPEASADDPPAVAQPAPKRPARLVIDRIGWSNSDVSFLDRATDPPTHLRLQELGFELTNLVLGGSADDAQPEPAQFRARLRSVGLIDELTLQGSVLSRPGPLDLEATLALHGEGLRGDPVAPYLRAVGLEPTLQSGTVDLGISAHVFEGESGLQVDLEAFDGLLADAELRWMELESLTVGGLRPTSSGLEIDAVRIRSPRMVVSRDSEGRLGFAGLRTVPAPATTDVTAESAQPIVPAAAEKGVAPAAAIIPALPPIRVGTLALEGATLDWRDGYLDPPLAARLVGSWSGTELNTAGVPSNVEAVLSVPGSLEELRWTGVVSLGNGMASAGGAVRGRGIRAGELARLLPAGVELESEEGALAFDFATEVGSSLSGGMRASFELADFTWGEAGAAPWLGCEALRAAVAHYDLNGSAIELGELTTRNVRAHARRATDGSLHALGLALGTPPQARRAAPAAAPAERALGGPKQRVSQGALEQAPKQASQQALEQPRPAALELPRVALNGEFRVGIDHFVFHDETLGENARPVDASLAFSFETPCVLMDDDPRELAPVVWRLEGAVAGLVEEWGLETSMQLFAGDPRLTAEWWAAGVRTPGLVELVPPLAASLEGNVEHGVIEGAAQVDFAVRRARPRDLGFDRAFGADVQLSGLAFRESAGGTVLAGVDAIHLDIPRIDPAKQRVHIKSIEIVRPQGLVVRDADSLSAVGLSVALAPAAESAEPVPQSAPHPTATPRPEDALVQTDEPRVSPPQTAASQPAPGLRIDEIRVTGIDFSIRDESGSEPLVLPLRQLDVELKRFTTRAFTEPRKIRFNALLAAGPPELGGRPREAALPVFEEFAAAGSVGLFPAPTGWAQVRLSAFELEPFSYLTEAQGLRIDDGALDVNARVQLKGQDGVKLNTTLTFSDLKIDEPEGGALESALGLPMPLGAALYLLRSPNGEHRFSVGVSQHPEDGIGLADMGTAAAGALAEVIATAVAGAPFRVIGAVVPLSPDAVAPQILEFDFLPGSTELCAADTERLLRIADRLANDRALKVAVRHELGQADMDRASRLANPTAEQCLELAAGLRLRKTELWREHSRLARETHALYALDSDDAWASSERLASLNQELDSVEAALDRVLGIVRSNSPRQQEKRARVIARDLCDLRLAAAEELLRLRVGRPTEVRAHDDPVSIASPKLNVESDVGRLILELRRD